MEILEDEISVASQKKGTKYLSKKIFKKQKDLGG